MMDKLTDFEFNRAMSDHLAVYRKETTYYRTKKGFAFKVDLIKLKRKSYGFDALEDDFMGCDSLSSLPINLHKVPDGEYSVEVINVSKDWETGIVDGWDLILKPLTQTNSEAK